MLGLSKVIRGFICNIIRESDTFQGNAIRATENAKTIFRRGILSGLKLIAHLTPLRHLMNALNLGVMEDSPAKFLRSLVTGTMSHRQGCQAYTSYKS